MTKNGFRIVFIGLSIFLIILVLGFSGSLNIYSLQKEYANSLVNSYKVVGIETVKRIEYGIEYGKKLESFYDIKSLLKEASDGLNVSDAKIILKDGTIAYKLNENDYMKKLPQELQQIASFKDFPDPEEFKSTLYEDRYYVLMPIKDEEGHWDGTLSLEFHKAFVDNLIIEKVNPIKMWLVALSVVCGVVFVLMLWRFNFLNDNGEIRRKFIFVVFFSVLGISQVIYGVLNFITFKNIYIDISNNNSLLAANVIKNNVDSIVNKGIAYEDFNGVEGWMHKIIKSIPEIENIYIEAAKESIIYKTSESSYIGDENYKSKYIYSLDLKEDHLGYKAKLNVVISKSYIDNKLIDVALDSLSVLVTSFIFMIELTIFVLLYMERKIVKGLINTKYDNLKFNIGNIRILSFLFCMGHFMSVSFIPVIMKEIYKPVFGISESVMIGIPISMEVFFGGIANLFGGTIVDKKGWRHSFFIGIIVISLGTILSAIAKEPILFIVARSLVGFGYGFVLIAVQKFSTLAPEEEEKNKGIFAMNSGAHAGLNCGAMLGAMIVDTIGFSKVFFIALILFISALILAAFLTSRKKEDYVEEMTANIKEISIIEFFKNRRVMSFFICIIIPLAISSMFLNYFLPIYGEKNNISTSNIGRAFLIYGLSVIYVGPYINNFINKYISTWKAVVLANVLVAVAILGFTFTGTIIAIYLAVILMGISESFGDVARYNYYLGIKEVRSLGEGKSLAFLNTAGTFGETLGPMIFSFAIVLGDKEGVGVVAIFIIAMTSLFWCISKIGKRGSISRS